MMKGLTETVGQKKMTNQPLSAPSYVFQHTLQDYHAPRVRSSALMFPDSIAGSMLNVTTDNTKT